MTESRTVFEQVYNWPIAPQVTSGEHWRDYLAEFVTTFTFPSRLTLEGLLQRELTLAKALFLLKRVFVESVVDSLPAAIGRDEIYDHNAGCYMFRLDVPNDGLLNMDVPGLPNRFASGFVFINAKAPPDELRGAEVPWPDFVEIIYITALRTTDPDGVVSRTLVVLVLNDSTTLSGAQVMRLPNFENTARNFSRSFVRHVTALLSIGEETRLTLFPVSFQRAISAGGCVARVIDIFYLRYASLRMQQSDPLVAKRLEDQFAVVRKDAQQITIALTELRDFVMKFESRNEAERGDGFSKIRALAPIARRVFTCLLRNDFGINVHAIELDNESFGVV